MQMGHILEGWERWFGIQKELSRDPEGRLRQPEWLRDHILKCLWCQGHAGLERHKVGEEHSQIWILVRSLR